MKHLLLFFLFSGSLDGFSQDTFMRYPSGLHYIMRKDFRADTLRATLIVYYDNGPAILHTKPGFVVIHYGGPHIYDGETYLDDKKKIIKAPWEVLTYKLKK